MGKSSGSKKFAIHAALFKPEPPMTPKEVKALFCGRKLEFERGLRLLQANWDTNGQQAKRGDKRPWVIHGESRSGKSHLARRIFVEIKPTAKRIQHIEPANGRMDAKTVMREIFEAIRGEFMNRILDQRLDPSPLHLPRVTLVRQLIEKIGLFDTSVQAVELTVEQTDRESLDVSAELAAAPLLSKFLAKFQTERTAKQGVKLSLRPPTPDDLATVCGIMIETLLWLKLIQHALLLVDDVDLLEGYQSPTQHAREQRSLLAHALDQLHNTPGVDVVLTARSWYVHSRKDLQTLVDLAESLPLRPDDLAEIHNRRLKVYGKGHPGFLHTEALVELGHEVDGLPGVYIQHLDSAFYQFQIEGRADAGDFGWLMNGFRRRFNNLRERCRAGVEAIEQAIRDRRLTVDVTDGNPFLGTALDNEFVYQSYYNERTYFISGLVRRLLAGELEPGDST